MRKWHKKQILELMETLRAACRELSRHQGRRFIGLCAEMQDFVSSVTEFAEGVLESDSRLVKLLGTFQEMLSKTVQGGISVKQLIRFTHEIEKEVSGLKPDKIEVVFFCYKASMADAFESVYFSAKEDPACDAYFIPIPYFDRNADGSLGQMHFEGAGCYPDGYQLTDWTKYNIEARCPDVIFIMNPYDENNYVTSVHPDFYSRRLRELTDMLVYIEYGLPFWMDREPAAEYEKIRVEGTLLPVYFFCHYYIAYSKEVVEFFRALFQVNPEAAQSFHLTPRTVNEKFVPLGSPKFDKVLNDRREDYVLPEAWSKKISGKKVILYNCSISEFLKASGQQQENVDGGQAEGCLYFRKMRSIIDAFKGRDDVVLWLRPHPLFEATLKSMRPSLAEEYHTIVGDFESLHAGIFDGTQDLHRAIAWSDAMISDESSLLFLYTATGKPFYIPSVTMACRKPVHDRGTDFHAPLMRRLENMRAAKGANVGNWNICIWWHNFLEEDLIKNTHFDNFTSRFIDYCVYPEQYPEAVEYQRLQIQMFRDFVANADGTAGRKIYGFVKEKSLA